jgi:hypothetical protein
MSSKKIENDRAAVALRFGSCNFRQIHGSLRVTPAMEAGITDHVRGEGTACVTEPFFVLIVALLVGSNLEGAARHHTENPSLHRNGLASIYSTCRYHESLDLVQERMYIL